MKKQKGITLIALVVTIVVLLILVGISIAMLRGDNGVITQAQKAKDETEQARVEELVELAIVSLTAENQGDKSRITPMMIAGEVNKMENRTDVKPEISTFPTNIIFETEHRKVGVDINVSLTKTKENGMYSIPGLEAEAEKNVDLFDYEIISDAEIGETTYDTLPTKEARITGIKPKYCNSGGYIAENGEKYGSTNYEIVLEDGIVIDTLVVPFQIEIEGEMYKITEVNLGIFWYTDSSRQGYVLPHVRTIIYPNTVRKIYGDNHVYGMGEGEKRTENIILPQKLEIIGNKVFYNCNNLKNIIIPNSITSIGEEAFYNCNSLKVVNYRGTQEQWNQITIGAENSCLINATINCNYTGK